MRPNEAVEKLLLILLASASECMGAVDGAIQIGRHEPAISVGGDGGAVGAWDVFTRRHHLVDALGLSGVDADYCNGACPVDIIEGGTPLLVTRNHHLAFDRTSLPRQRVAHCDYQ